jgi:hypothetical protein
MDDVIERTRKRMKEREYGEKRKHEVNRNSVLS